MIVSANFTSLKIKGSLISAVGQSAFLTSASKRTQFESIALQVVNALSRTKSREMLGRWGRDFFENMAGVTVEVVSSVSERFFGKEPHRSSKLQIEQY